MLSDMVRELMAYDERQRMVVKDRPKLTELIARTQAEGPSDYSSLRWIGVGLLLLGEFDQAAEHLDRALELADTPEKVIAARINLADVYRYRGDLPTSELICRLTLELARAEAPDWASYPLQHLGKTLAEQGRAEAARQVFTEALELRRDDPEPAATTRAAMDVVEDLALPLPAPVAELLGQDAVWDHDDHGGQSGTLASVTVGDSRPGDGHRPHTSPAGPRTEDVQPRRYFVRRGPEAVAEHERLVWLREWADVPEVAVFAGDVLVTADTGVETLDDQEKPVEVGAAMGRMLRELHSVPVASCPFDGRLDTMLAKARRNVIEGLVDPDDFDDDNLGRTPREVLDRLIAERPAHEDLVVAHGDFTPSNVMANDVLIDLARLGVADRYRDLAIALRDLDDDFGQAAVDAFLAAYGLTDPDPAKLAYYRLLDELF